MTRRWTSLAALGSLARTMRRFRPHVRAQRTLVVRGSLALLAVVVLRLLEPWPLKFIIDSVAQPVSGATEPPDDPLLVITLAAVGVVLLTGARAGAAYLSTVAFALAGNRMLTQVRSEVYAHIQRLSPSFHGGARSGDLVTRVTGDVGRLQEVAVTAALPLLGNVVTLVGMFAVMLWIDPDLTLLALVALPLFLVTSVRLSGRITGVSRKQRRQEGRLASAAAESVGAIRTVQAYGLEPVLQRTFAADNDRSLKEGVQAKRLAAGLERKTDVLIAIATGLVLYVGARHVLTGALTPGELVVFVSYLKSAFKPLRDMAKYTGRLAKASASGERIVDLLDTEPAVQDTSWARPAPPFRGDVRLDGVTARHGGGRGVHDVSLHVHPGETVGVVGPSGAGKSTLVSLLLRLQDPDSGRVVIDGHDLRDLTLSSVRAQMAIVLQESVLFATTVRENIAYGAVDPDAVTDEAIERAARAANVHDFVVGLADGYDTVLGERGATLSGGERQRIAIARAVVRDAAVVILDEPLSGLDADNEAEVAEALRRLCRGRTTFIISHDVESLLGADRVVVLEDGRVVADGPPADVLARSRASRPAGEGR